MTTRNPGPVLADTDVLSFVFNGAPMGAYYIEQLRGSEVVVSFRTVEELWYGAYLRGWGERRKSALEQFLGAYRMVLPDQSLTRYTALLRADLEQAGRRLNSSHDEWIAATALWLDCPLAAHDRDFTRVRDLRLIQAPAP